MMHLLLFAACMIGSTYGQEKVYKLYPWFPKSLGRMDPAGIASTLEYYKQGCKECFELEATTYAHSQSCNVYITCVDQQDSVTIYANMCSPGTSWDPKAGCNFNANVQCPTPESDITNCQNGHKTILDLHSCGAYYECIGGVMQYNTCPPGKGFNLLTQTCDYDCATTGRREYISTECSEFPGDKTKYRADSLIRENGEVNPRQVSEIVPCPADTEHIEKTACRCDPIQTVKACENVTLISFSASSNTWALAKAQTPVPGSSALMGNASISVTDNLGAAYFAGKNTFQAPMIKGNDLGEYFAFQFEFQAQLGADMAGEFVALADNSFCNIDPTYGCKLEVLPGNMGRVICYISPDNYNFEVKSQDLDLSQRISVYFARQGINAILVTGTPGSAGQEARTIVSEGVRATGNECPLSIGGGTAKKYFKGYIDEMYLRKYCSRFMP